MTISKSINPNSNGVTLYILSLVTWVQSLCTAGMLLIPTLATHIAISLEVPTSLVGIQISFLYFVAMFSSLQSATFVRRFGGCRTSQIAIIFVILGCMMALMNSVYGMLACTIFLGLAYGINGPAAADLLTQFTPSARRNLIFSIKQTGVPLGGILISITGPPLASLWGWKSAFVAIGVVCLLTLFILQHRRHYWDESRNPLSRTKKLNFLSFLDKGRPFLWLGASGFFLSSVQICLLSFAVIFMVESLLIPLITAGFVASIIHFSGMVGRISWGFVADLLGDSILVLLFLSGMTSLFFIILVISGYFSSAWISMIVLIASGLSVISWNGVYLAEAAR